jgi:multicomponent Na+:H+ antiporter subunit E
MIRLIGKFGLVVGLLGLFLRELGASAFRVGVLALTPDLEKALSPGLIDYPLTVRSDAAITLLANLITLTPGTLSVDVSADRRLLHIHALVARDPEAVIASIRQTFERPIEALFS